MSESPRQASILESKNNAFRLIYCGLCQDKKANDQPTIKNTITNDLEDIDILDAGTEPDIYMDPNADYDEQYDGVPTNSLQKELDSNYEREARLKRYKRIQEPSDEDDEPISIPTVILEQIEQEKAQRQNERLSIQQDKEILARRKKYLEDAKKEIDQARNDLD